MELKKSIEDLAIFGGKAEFEEKLHVGRPNIGDRKLFLERINDILDRKWLSNNGPYVKELERRIAEYVGVKHCIVTCNGTIALEIAIRALGINGEVIVPSFTFIATAHALQWQEITPVFCDIDPKTLTIDTQEIERLITPRTTGIIGVNLFGQVCNIVELTEIARRKNLKLLFDSSHTFGCSKNGRMVGSFGDAEVFSFHATKFINSIEGGAVVTNDKCQAKKIRLMKNFGFVGVDDVEYIGTNGKMNEISAAMGLTSLESIDDFIKANYRNFKLYLKELKDIKGVRLRTYDESEKNNYQYIIVIIDDSVTGINRDDLMKLLQYENVLARRYFYPCCHNMEPYRSYFPNARLLLPQTEYLTQHVLCLPTGTAIGENEVKRVCAIVRFAISNGREISAKLSQHKENIIRPIFANNNKQTQAKSLKALKN
jgi:dTDP-4-amino-4,6-dideoxygalactose transaminase